MPSNPESEEDSDDFLYSDPEDFVDKGEEHIHPFTEEPFRYEDIVDLPQYKKLMESMEECSDPGHSCRKNWEHWIRTVYHDTDAIPEERTQMKCLSRKKWGAAPSKAPPEAPSRPTLKLVLYYDVGMPPCYTQEECIKSVRELQRRQMEEDGLSDIGFNFVVGGDTNMYEGRGWHAQPDKSLKFPQWRHRRMDVAFISPLDEEARRPEYELINQVFDFFRVAVMNHSLDISSDLYEIHDHYKALVPSPPRPILLVKR